MDLTEWLNSIGKSQIWLAGELGESKQAVNNWTRGKSKIPWKHKERLESLGYSWTVGLKGVAASDETIKEAYKMLYAAFTEAGVSISSVPPDVMASLIAMAAKQISLLGAGQEMRDFVVGVAKAAAQQIQTQAAT